MGKFYFIAIAIIISKLMVFPTVILVSAHSAIVLINPSTFSLPAPTNEVRKGRRENRAEKGRREGEGKRKGEGGEGDLHQQE